MISKIIKRPKSALHRVLMSSGPLTRKVYYKFFSSAFSREQAAVGAGIAKYNQDSGSGQDLFLLRRNIHMLEKGLTMRPRRDSFGHDYIERTVRSFAAASSGEGSSLMASTEVHWMYSVLHDYFEATVRSTDPRVQSLRGTFDALSIELGPRLELGCGPHTPSVDVPPVGIEALTGLAERRKSVRWFTDQPVSREIVDRAIRVGAESPTACNRQPYRFEVVDDPASVAKVAAIPMGTNGYRDQIAGLVVVVGDLSAFFDERDRHLIYVDGCLAAMGLVYGFEAQGIGTCCINWPDIPEKEAAMASLLGLSRHERVIMLLAYGYADATALVPNSAKKDLAAVRRFRKL